MFDPYKYSHANSGCLQSRSFLHVTTSLSLLQFTQLLDWHTAIHFDSVEYNNSIAQFLISVPRFLDKCRRVYGVALILEERPYRLAINGLDKFVMHPSGEEMIESRTGFGDYSTSSCSSELRGSPFGKATSRFSGNLATSSSSGDVQSLLECPVCISLMYPPIYQCPNGHTLCSSCKARVHNSCPTCRGELGNIRCLALEKVAESLELPCKYQFMGCPDIFPYYGNLKHEKNCKYRPYNCPYAGAECSVTGDIHFLVMHLKNDHKVDMHNGCTFNHRYVKSNPQDIDNATWMLTIFNCFGRQFCLHFEAFQIGTGPVYMAFLRFMGSDDEARQFSYSLEVGGNGRKLIWQGIPRSIRDSHRKVRDSQDGLIIHRNMALFFSGGDQQELKLKVAGRIWKEH